LVATTAQLRLLKGLAAADVLPRSRRRGAESHFSENFRRRHGAILDMNAILKLIGPPIAHGDRRHLLGLLGRLDAAARRGHERHYAAHVAADFCMVTNTTFLGNCNALISGIWLASRTMRARCRRCFSRPVAVR
jgi:hypothetical protein